MTLYQFKLEKCYAVKDEKYIKHLFFELIEQLNFHVRGVIEHYFYPYGLTISVILSESNANLHTWTETDQLDISIYHCGNSETISADELFDLAMKLFRPASIKYAIIDMESVTPMDCGIYM
jgi:S-adenosylmethionine decarboxylase